MKNTIKVAQLAAIANLTAQRIYQLVSDGHLPAIQDGKLPRDESISALFKFYQRDGEELKRERLLLTAANRELKEQELRIARGEFIDKQVARNSILIFANQFKTLVKLEIEKSGPAKRREELIRIGLSEIAIQQFHVFDLAAEAGVIDRIEAQCAAASKVNPQ